MQMSFLRKFCLLALLVAAASTGLPRRCPAPLIIRQGEGASYVAPGAEEVPNARDAQAQFDNALERETRGDLTAAIAGYNKTVRRFPKASVAATALFKQAQLQEKTGQLVPAFKAYDKLVREYPRSLDFDKALEGEFRLGTAFLEGARQKVLGVPTLPSMNQAIIIFTSIVKSAPFSRYAPLAQFGIGQAKEKENDLKGAVQAYQVVVDKYPTDPAAADALYQIGFVWMRYSRTGNYDRAAVVKARETFQDFLAAYPNTEKAAQARENLAALGVQQTGGAFQIAKYYDKQKQYRAAIVYYNEVIRQEPNSKESEQAKTRLAALRARFGDAAMEAAMNPNVTAPGAKPGDNRLQARTDTARRPDYNGPAVSAPAPPVTASTSSPSGGVGGGGGGRSGSSGYPSTPLPLPPPIPDAAQPPLPASENNATGSPLAPGAEASPAPVTPQVETPIPTLPSAPAAAPSPSNP
jgi:outer membrane protein assembly factor BamD